MSINIKPCILNRLGEIHSINVGHKQSPVPVTFLVVTCPCIARANPCVVHVVVGICRIKKTWNGVNIFIIMGAVIICALNAGYQIVILLPVNAICVKTK